MPSFNAQEREVGPAGRPGENTAPEVDANHFGFDSSAGSTMHKVFTYASRKHVLTDLLRPGYFNKAREFGIGLWDIVTCTVGADPGTAFEVDLRIIQMPSAKQQPVMVAKGQMRPFTPVRHDGSLAGDETTGRKAA